MRKVIVIAAAFGALSFPALATDNHPPPKPTPAPTNVQGQAQGQVQGQAQGQTQKAYGGRGGAGGTGGAGGAGGVGQGGAGGIGQGGAGGSQSQNQNQDVTVNNNGNGSNNGGGNGWNGNQFPVASATAPSFAIGQCQWAVAGGAQFFGFGASGGGAGLYEFCKGMMQADHFRKIGREDMAKLMECNFDNFRAAYRDAGTPCRQDVPKEQQAVTPIVQQPGVQYAAAPIPVPLASNGNTTAVVAGAVPMSKAPVCRDARGNVVPTGQPGAVRCQ